MYRQGIIRMRVFGGLGVLAAGFPLVSSVVPFLWRISYTYMAICTRVPFENQLYLVSGPPYKCHYYRY